MAIADSVQSSTNRKPKDKLQNVQTIIYFRLSSTADNIYTSDHVIVYIQINVYKHGLSLEYLAPQEWQQIQIAMFKDGRLDVLESQQTSVRRRFFPKTDNFAASIVHS